MMNTRNVLSWGGEMKTSRTMHKLARARAVGYGPRKIGGKFGYGLTDVQMQRLFFDEGFNTTRKTWTAYITEWMFYGFVTHDEQNGAYWFSMNPTLEAEARKSAVKAGVSMNDIVTGPREVEA